MKFGVIALALVLGACWQGTVGEPNPQAGSLSLALTGVDLHGHAYRLREAVFEISGCGYDYPAGAGAGGAGNCSNLIVSSEDDPTSELIARRLIPGSYSVYLRDGWLLEELSAGGPVPVEQVVLLSPQSQYAYVWDGGESRVNYSFGVGGELIDFRGGQLSIGISVEQPGDPTCGGSPCNVAGGGGFGSAAGVGGFFGFAGSGG